MTDFNDTREVTVNEPQPQVEQHVQAREAPPPNWEWQQQQMVAPQMYPPRGV